MPPVRPLGGIFFCTRGEYFTMSNGVFNFNVLALVFSEILGGSQIDTKIFCTRGEYFTTTNGIFNFNFLALVFSEILGVQNLH